MKFLTYIGQWLARICRKADARYPDAPPPTRFDID